jgi:hypothetical protein
MTAADQAVEAADALAWFGHAEQLHGLGEVDAA